MNTPAADYEGFVEHPRYGKGPRLTGLDVAETLDGSICCHWHSPVGVRIPHTAIVANTSRQRPATVPVTHYFDARRVCRKCGRAFLFFAEEQRFWYEELGFPLEADCVECVPCRKDERQVQVARRRYEALLGRSMRNPAETAELLECGVLLVESAVFSVKVIPKLRALLKTLQVDAEGLRPDQVEELTIRVTRLDEPRK
jgi:hypothetical protein